MKTETKQEEFDQLKPIKVTFNGDGVIFYLRMISVAEEMESLIRVRDMSDFSDEEKDKKQFEVFRDALSKFSTQDLTLVVGDKEAGTQKVSEYFAEYSPRKSRMAASAFYNFKTQLEPDSSFL